MSRVFRILPEGASYRILYSDVNFLCQTCGVSVNKMSYDERSGIGEWICPDLHHSTEKIGV